MKRNIKNGQSITYSIFSGNKLTQKDIQSIINYSDALKKGPNLGKAWNDNMKGCSVAAKQYVKDAKKAGKSTDELVSELKEVPKTSNAASIGLKALSVAGNMLVSMAIFKGIELIASAIDNYANRVKYAQERLDEFSDTVSESKKNLETQEEWIKEHGKRYEELSRGVDNYGHVVSLTADEISEYNSLTKDIESMFPNMITGYNDQNQAIIKMKGSVEALTESYKANVEAAYASTLAKSSEGFGDYKTAIEDAESAKKTIESVLNADKITGFSKSSGGFGFQIGSDVSLNKDDYIEDELSNLLDNDTYNQLIKEVKAMPEKSLLNSNQRIFQFTDLSTGLQQKIRAALTTANATIKTETAKVKPILEAFVYGNDGKYSGFNELDEEGKQAIRNVISSLDDSFYEQFDSDSDMASYFYSYFIDPLKDGLNKTDLAVKINTLFSLNQNDYKSYQEYVNAVNAIINQIKADKDKDGNPLYSEEQINGLQNRFGVGKLNNSGQLSGQSLIDTVKGKYSSIKGADEFIKTLNEKELRVLYDLKPDESKSLEDLKIAIDNINKEINKKSTPKSFTQVWKSIGKSGNEETDKADLEEKKKLEELAEAGKLTKEKLKNSSLAEEFTKAGVSIEEATDKINKMKSSVTQLASMKTGISSISSILGQKEENLSNKKTKKQGIGIDTLEAMPDDVKSQTAEYEHFVEVLGNGKSTMNDCKDAANKLATAYVNSNNFLANLTDETEGYYTSVLKEMGVENAAAVVRQSLNDKKSTEIMLGWDIVSATDEEIAAKADEINAIAGSNEALKQYTFQKALASEGALDTSDSIQNLIALADQCGVTGKVVVALRDLLKETSKLEDIENDSLSNYTASIQTDAQHAVDEAYNAKGNAHGKQAEKVSKLNRKLQKLLEKGETALKVDLPSSSNSNSSSKNDKNAAKETKQTIDWIERRLSNLQKVIDLTAAKFQNIFQIGKQKSNLDKQIKTTKQLIKEYGLAAEKYQKKANQIAAGKTKTVKTKKGKKKKVKNKLSKSIIKKIKTGKLTKKTKVSSLIKAYGSDKAEQIQSYIDYNDKAQSAKKSKIEQIAKQRELKQQKLQLDVDLYNERVSRAEAKEAIAIGAKKKNASVNKQIKNIQLSYDKQIAIAKLTKGEKSKAEIDRLKYEKQKKITDLKVHQIDNIKKDYENKLIPIDNAKQKTQNEVSLLEAKGRIVTANYYRKQNEQETNKRNTLQNELKELQGKLKSGTFTEYSDEWYPYTKTALDLHHFYTISLKKYAKL